MTVFRVPHDVMAQWRGETLWSDVREMLVHAEWPLPSQMTEAPPSLKVLATEAHRSDALDWVDRGLALRVVFWGGVWGVAILLLLVVVQFGPPWAGNVGFVGPSSRPSTVFFAPILILLGAIVVSMYGPRFLPSGQFRTVRLTQLTSATATLGGTDFVWATESLTVHNLPSAAWLSSHRAWVVGLTNGLPHLGAPPPDVQALHDALQELTTALQTAQERLNSDVSSASSAGQTLLEVDRTPLHALLATIDAQCGRLEPSRRWLEPLPAPFPITF